MGFYVDYIDCCRPANRMKIIHSAQTVTVPDDVSVHVNGRKVTVEGPRGSLLKDFGHLKIELKKTGAHSVKVDKWFGTRRDLACVRTVCSHITNMATGVTKGTVTRCVQCTLISPSIVTSLMKVPILKSETFWVRSLYVVSP